MSEEREHDDAGEGRDVGQGYPEEEPGGASPQGESAERSGGGDKDEKSGGPEQATGNPGAAG
jgi:hypothetical protein